MPDHQALIEKFGRALNEASPQLFGELLAEDYVEEYPQSGEVIRGCRARVARPELEVGKAVGLTLNRRVHPSKDRPRASAPRSAGNGPSW